MSPPSMQVYPLGTPPPQLNPWGFCSPKFIGRGLILLLGGVGLGC